MSGDEHVLWVPGVESADVPLVRNFVRSRLDRLVPDEVARDLELAASELVTNAWAHASPATVAVGVSVTAERATISVTCTSSSDSLLHDVTEWTMPAPDELEGRGLGIVRATTDGVEIEQRGSSLAISVHRELTLGPDRRDPTRPHA